MEVSKINIQQLLEPINNNLPCGEDIMYDENFLLIKRERQQPDNQNLGVWVLSDNKETNWRKVENLCLDLLKNKAKDLMLCCYLLEARIKQYGVLGLSDTCELFLSMTKKYWKDIYPTLTEDNESRKSPFLWLDDKLPMLLKTNPLFIVKGTNNALYFKDIESYIIKKEITENVQSLITYNNNDNLVNIQKELNETESFLLELRCYLIEVSLLDNLVFTKSLEVINVINKFIFSNLKFTKEDNVFNKNIILENESELIENKISHNSEKNLKLTRNEVYQNLKKQAELLLEIEPHSPVPLIIMRALKWESKSFIEIVFEVLKISNDKNSLLSLFHEQQVEDNYSDSSNNRFE